MRRRRDDRGSATAEFAIALPAAVLVLLLAIAGLSASARVVRLQDAAADAARLVARGEDPGRASAAVAAAVDGATAGVEERGDVVCVTASAAAGIPLPVPALSASSCALAGGL